LNKKKQIRVIKGSKTREDEKQMCKTEIGGGGIETKKQSRKETKDTYREGMKK
jgi:hypothetical protein